MLTRQQALALLTAPGSAYATHSERVPDADGEEFTTFVHVPRTLPELFALSARHDERTFIVYEDERYTFAEVTRRARSLAHHLVSDFGIGRGDRVALAMRNYPEWALSYVAVTSIGAIIVPLNAWWTTAELRYGIEDSGAKLVIVDPERFDRLEPVLPELGVAVLLARAEGEACAGTTPIEPLLMGDHVAPAVEIDTDDDATIMYTSGSTGHPKGVVSTHRAVVSSVFCWEVQMMSRVMTMWPPPMVERVRAWLQKGAEALREGLARMPQRSMLITVPLFHVTGCNVQFLPAFRNGRKIVMMHKWNAERALELIEREKITDFNGVPTMSWELVNSPDFAKRDTSSLQSLSSGGAARPPDQVKKLSERASGAQASTGYGMTETNSVGTAIGGEEYQLRPESVGRALQPLVEIKIVDEDGNTLGADTEGEICIKSVTNMRGYWGKPQATLETLRRGWIHTGDLGRVDAEGFVYITGRAKDIVIRGGENISCPEVEHAIYEHPAVFEAAVYGVPDARLGEAVAATIMVRPGVGLTVEELRRHVAARLASFKVPAHIWLQEEQLPRIASGKIDKRTLKQLGAERLGSE